MKQLQRLQVHDQRLGEYLISGPFARLAEILLGEPPDPQNLQYFNKAPGVNRATPAHQDGAYFPIEPMNAVTIWLALEDIGPAQGCLRYLRGSHRDGLRPHRRSCTLGFSRELIGDASKNVEREVAFPCAAGHVMAHHALMVHRADGNTSIDRHRRALGFIYFGDSCVLDEGAYTEYQARLAEDLRKAERPRSVRRIGPRPHA